MDALLKTCPKCGGQMKIKSWVLSDLKTWGSWKVARVLGIQKFDNGTEVYTDKAGRKRSKTIYRFEEHPELGDWFDVGMQLNRYRVLIEEYFPIDRMQIQITVRDGGLQVVTSRGITELIYVREINKINDEEVKEFFIEKQARFDEALDIGEEVLQIPGGLCTLHERWDDNKCKRYCEVKQFCPHGRLIKEG